MIFSINVTASLFYFDNGVCQEFFFGEKHNLKCRTLFFYKLTKMCLK